MTPQAEPAHVIERRRRILIGAPDALPVTDTPRVDGVPVSVLSNRCMADLTPEQATAVRVYRREASARRTLRAAGRAS